MNVPPTHLQDQIKTIAKHEQEFLEKRSSLERLGDSLGAFIGSLAFITLHLCWCLGWVLLNTLNVRSLSHFDPPPFPMLDSIVAMEAIFLVSFVVMRQNRMGRRADQRDHMILQLMLLTEKEVTAVLGLERQIAAKVGLGEVAKESEIEQLSQDTSIDEVAQTLRDHIPTE